jgi:molybdenum cofactor biosynthesis enzyme MoaA
MARRTGHDHVLKTLDLALQSELEFVKLNVVVIRGLNDDEILKFVEMTRTSRIIIRFIEYMPFTGIVVPDDAL